MVIMYDVADEYNLKTAIQDSPLYYSEKEYNEEIKRIQGERLMSHLKECFIKKTQEESPEPSKH